MIGGNRYKIIEAFYNILYLSHHTYSGIELIDIKSSTLKYTVNALWQNNIIAGYSRNQVFAFRKYIHLFLK